MSHLMHQGMDGIHPPPQINPELNMPPQPPMPAHSGSANQPRKRKKLADGDHQGPSEPRRLRRSHEACARCRSKKIKCDSKHPRCTACASAGVQCHQEDRYRQTLTPRGYIDSLERQFMQCQLLLKSRINGFDVRNLDEYCAQEGIDVDAEQQQALANFPFSPTGRGPPFPLPPPRGDGAASPDGKAYPYSAMHPHPGYPPGAPIPYPMPGMAGGPMSPPPFPYPPQYMPHIHPSFHPVPPQGHHHMQESEPLQRSVSTDANQQDVEVKGQDPQSLDMTTTQGLVKTFGISPSLANEAGNGGHPSDREDLAVGSGSLTSGRDRNGLPDYPVQNPDIWIQVDLRTGSSTYPTISIWLPRAKQMLRKVINVYFTRLNPHRPVFIHDEFDTVVESLYAQENIKIATEETPLYDPGFICSLYLILALGTLSELSHSAASYDTKSAKGENEIVTIGTMPKALLPEGWPTHSEFFDRALIVKADLRITVSSLQALILLHWYLYIERQGRSLWRLVGHLVRLSTELGLHHDPTTQIQTFTESECQLRIRLWAIVMIHDRGTSILLGRPLAIAPSDSNTPRPQRPKEKNNSANYSDHFIQSAGIVNIQADIIISLYQPNKQAPDAIMRHARRITKSMVEFRNQLPESYQPFFAGSELWPRDKKMNVVQAIVDDNGLTLLKYWIARILLLRVLFGYKELGYQHRLTALTDAIQTAHNIIVAHNSLIRFPDIAFFVSPIPIHIAAMVILYGHMSKVPCLDRQTALEDVWMALGMLPRLRWRWERKDYNGEHPLIAKLAEKVFDVTLSQERPVNPARLIPEMSWESESMPPSPVVAAGSQNGGHGSGSMKSPHSSSKQIGHKKGNGTPQPYSSGPNPYSPHGSQGSNQVHPFPEIPVSWFYPSSDVPFGGIERSIGDGQANDDTNDAIDMILPERKPQPTALGSIGCEPSNDAFLNEERDETLLPSHMNPWVQHMEQRDLRTIFPQHEHIPAHQM